MNEKNVTSETNVSNVKGANKYVLFDYIIIALLAAAGVVVKPYISTAVHFISTPLMIPGGTLAGGLYMLWLVLAFAVTGKHGSPSLVGLVQAVTVMISGISAMPWIVTLISYTVSGVAADLVLLLSSFVFKVPFNKATAFFACMAANIAGTLVVSKAIFALPALYLAFTVVVAAFSGGVGGLLAWEVAHLLKRHGVLKRIQR
ncbi:MAG: ECF transporter S component [Clostridiales Family XIII bacterium]|nr:ECF transporter S component [Clostridiales Family XIII bacterium]